MKKRYLGSSSSGKLPTVEGKRLKSLGMAVFQDAVEDGVKE